LAIGSRAEINGHDVEILPARTALSLFSAGGSGQGGLGGNLVEAAASGCLSGAGVGGAKD
jgi:hypothetical protein